MVKRRMSFPSIRLERTGPELSAPPDVGCQSPVGVAKKQYGPVQNFPLTYAVAWGKTSFLVSWTVRCTTQISRSVLFFFSLRFLWLLHPGGKWASVKHTAALLQRQAR